MKARTIKLLKNFLSNDNDFYNLWKTKTGNNNPDEFIDDLYNFIDGMSYEGLMSYYLLDKRYIDISYIVFNDDIINLDDLYIDFKLELVDRY